MKIIDINDLMEQKRKEDLKDWYADGMDALSKIEYDDAVKIVMLVLGYLSIITNEEE